MKRLMLVLAILAYLPAAAAGEQSWSGFLVDSKCYESLERNTDPWDTSTFVDRDRDWEIRYCSPNAKTKLFTLVAHDGMSLKLNAEGNAKAAELAGEPGKKKLFEVIVTGERFEGLIRVNTIRRALK